MKTTCFFSSEEAPTRVGLYRLRFDWGWGLRWSWWDGLKWNDAWVTKAAALNNKDYFGENLTQGLCDDVPFKWRGLMEPA